MRLAGPEIEQVILCLQAIARTHPKIRVGVTVQTDAGTPCHWYAGELELVTPDEDALGDISEDETFLRLGI